MLFPFAAFFKLYPIICNILGKLWSRDPSCKGPIENVVITRGEPVIFKHFVNDAINKL